MSLWTLHHVDRQRHLKRSRNSSPFAFLTCSNRQTTSFMTRLCNCNKSVRFIKPLKGTSSSRQSKFCCVHNMSTFQIVFEIFILTPFFFNTPLSTCVQKPTDVAEVGRERHAISDRLMKSYWRTLSHHTSHAQF